jgi:hypothetical protein
VCLRDQLLLTSSCTRMTASWFWFMIIIIFHSTLLVSCTLSRPPPQQCIPPTLNVSSTPLPAPQAGTWEPLIEHLPGAPDGVSTGRDGSFWVALVSPVPPIAKLLKDPVVRALYAWLPQWARPPLKKWGAVVKVGGRGFCCNGDVCLGGGGYIKPPPPPNHCDFTYRSRWEAIKGLALFGLCCPLPSRSRTLLRERCHGCRARRVCKWGTVIGVGSDDAEAVTAIQGRPGGRGVRSWVIHPPNAFLCSHKVHCMLL